MNPPDESNAMHAKPQPAVMPLLLAGLFMVVGLTFLIFLGREESRLEGEVVEELDLQPLLYTDQPLRLNDQKGKIVVLHFWGYWCPPCVMEYPGFAALQKDYTENADDVVFVSIASEGRSPEDKQQLTTETEAFLQSNDIPAYPIYWDPAEYSRHKVSLMFKGGGFGYPTTIVLDKEGKIADAWKGTVEKSTLRSSIEKLRK